MSLYRIYRPKDFPSLIGQEHISVTLLNAIKAGQIAHAYLFTGPRGTGKTTTARLMAKAINAEKMTEDGRFDGCEIAEEIDAGRLIDVIEIDAASNRGIDEIRDLREKINYSPTRARNKVYIIDEVHMLTKEAFNALLKTLEEPPSFVYFILATTEINKVPETIISRCQRFDFKRISEADILKRLETVCASEGIEAEEEALKIIARQSRGGLRDALSLLEQLISGKKLATENVKKVLGMSNFASIENVYEMIGQGKAAEAMEEINKLFMAGVDLVQFNKDFLDYLRGEMLEKVKAEKLAEAKRLIEIIGFFQEAYEKQKFSYIPELPLEVAIVKSALGGKMAALPKVPEQMLEVNIKASDMDQDDGSKKKPEPVIPTQIKKEDPSINPVQEVSTVPVQEIKPQEKPVNSAEFQVDLATLKARWPQILNRIHNPLAKRCLSAGQLLEITGQQILLGFASNFNKDKLFVPDLLFESEEAIAAELGTRLKLSGKVDPSLAPPAITEAKAESRPSWDGPTEIPAKPVEPKKDVLSSALNVFGGTIIE